MKRLSIVVVALALVVGVTLGGIVGNPFDGMATAAPPARGAACYTNWNSNTCAAGYTAVSTGVWTAVLAQDVLAGGAGAGLICAQAKTPNVVQSQYLRSWTKDSVGGSHIVANEPCAICCK